MANNEGRQSARDKGRAANGAASSSRSSCSAGNYRTEFTLFSLSGGARMVPNRLCDCATRMVPLLGDAPLLGDD